jgi:hypothetical protein
MRDLLDERAGALTSERHACEEAIRAGQIDRLREEAEQMLASINEALEVVELRCAALEDKHEEIRSLGGFVDAWARQLYVEMNQRRIFAQGPGSLRISLPRIGQPENWGGIYR